MFAKYNTIPLFLFVVLFSLSCCAPQEVDDPALESSADLTSSSGDIDPYQLWQGEYFGTVSGLRETEMTWKDGEIHHYQFNKRGLLLGVKSWDECRGDYFDPLCVEEGKWGFSINAIGCENQANFHVLMGMGLPIQPAGSGQGS